MVCCLISDGAVYSANINPAKQTEQFLNAVKAKDFKAIFDMANYYQEGISNIKANNPKMLWQKLINEYYENEKKRVFRREEGFSWQSYLESSLPDIHPATYIQALMIFLPDNSKWKVVESKKGILQDSMRVERSVFKVYITLTYKTAEESPLIDSRLFKEAIFEVIFDAKTGLYMQSSRLGNGDVFWDKVPLKIINIRWSADGFSGLHLFIKGIGGIPPYYSTTMCGEWIVEKLKEVNIESNADSISIHIRTAFPDESFPLQCNISITDKSGKEDIRIFTVPKMFTGVLDSFCYVTSPWYEWGQGVPEHCRSPLFKLESAGIEKKRELSLAIEKWSTTEGIKEEIKVLLVKKELEKIIKMREDAVDPLIILLNDEDDEVSKNAVEALGRIGDRRAVKPLIAALNGNRPIVRLYAILALGWIRDKQAEKLLRDLFVEKDIGGGFAELDEFRVALAFALYLMVEVEEKEIYWEFLISALKDKERDKWVRNNAAWAFGEIGRRALEPLKAALKDDDEDVRNKAEEAIKKISQVLQQHSSSKHLLVEKTSNFIWPVEDPVFSINPPNDFGSKDIVKKGYYHAGVDIKSESQDESKTPVSVVADGKVVAIFKTKDTKTRCDENTPIGNTVASEDNHGFGNTIIIEHDDNMVSLYAHLDCIEPGIEIGSEISQGDKIGNLGNSAYEKRVCSNGDVCNPSAPKDKRITGFGKHLHLEIKKKGILTNPEGSGLHFAYTPNHPDNYGYYDPKKIIGEIVLEEASSE